jgi:hypothetical protein
MPKAETLPLPVLLSRVLGSLTTEVESAAGVGPEVPSLAVWSNVLRCVADGSAGDERTLASAARISKRLATAAVTGANRRGWITASDPAKNRKLSLTDLGRSAATRWPEHLAALDSQWKETPLRRSLEELVKQVPLELPHYPATYGTADPSAVGGPYMQGAKRKDGVLAHGTDWKPIPRAEGDTLSSLPFTALLSQALMAFTIDYEDRFPWPLASTSNVLRHITSEPQPLADLPEGHEIKGNGKTLLERHMIVEVTTDAKKKKLVALTDRGEAVLHHHPKRLEAVEAEWKERFGEPLAVRLRNELGSLAGSAAGPDHVVAPLHLG